jgi:cytochrome c
VNREGPRLNGVYGRKAGSLPDFSYSEGLKKAGMRWDSANLNAWLTDPEAMVPDTDMAFRLPNEEERNAVIEYLRSLGKE